MAAAGMGGAKNRESRETGGIQAKLDFCVVERSPVETSEGGGLSLFKKIRESRHGGPLL